MTRYITKIFFIKKKIYESVSINVYVEFIKLKLKRMIAFSSEIDGLTFYCKSNMIQLFICGGYMPANIELHIHHQHRMIFTHILAYQVNIFSSSSYNTFTIFE